MLDELKKEALKQKILKKEKTIGMHVNFCDIGVAKIAGSAGYDFIWIDMEHSYLSYEALLSSIVAVKSAGTPVIVRAPQDDLTATKKILEMGVDGIIFPMVRTAEQANRLIAATLYPPYGNRGFGPMNAVDYGIKDIKEYTDNDHRTMCRFIQIEHKDAIENLDSIMENPYIDGYIFGPNDLSGSYDMLRDVFSEKITSVIQSATDKLHKNNKYVGLSTGDVSISTLEHWHNMNIDMISAGADFDFLRIGALENRKNLCRLWK